MSNRKTRRAPKSSSLLRTPEQARQWLRDNGITATGFATQTGISHDAIKDVLSGRAKGNFGETHRAAVALGIKRNPEYPTKSRNATQAG